VKAGVVVVVVALVAVASAWGRPADHTRPSPTVSASGSQTVPGGVHFSPVEDPFRGVWRGTVSWQVGCAEASGRGWEVKFVDLSSGTYGNTDPNREPPRAASYGGFVDSHYSYIADGGSKVVTIPAGSVVYPHIKGRCDYRDGHSSPVGEGEGSPIYVAPYVWYPTVRPTRALQALGRRPIVLKRGRPARLQLRIDARPTGQEAATVFLVGAGVRVVKAFGPGKLNVAPTVTVRPTKTGVLRYWVALAPYGTKSRVIGIRVR